MENGASAEVALWAAQDRAVLVAVVVERVCVPADIYECSPSLLLNLRMGRDSMPKTPHRLPKTASGATHVSKITERMLHFY
jgi:hypothetical protein